MEKQDVAKEPPVVPMGRSTASDSNKEATDEVQSNKNVATTGTQHEICRCCNSNNCVERMKILLDRDLEQRQLQVLL